jgi:hypothetical protein
MIQIMIRSLLLVSCLGLQGCLVHSGIVTENLSYAYVPEEQTLLIAGTTASAPDLNPFDIDDPIPYEIVKNEDGNDVELKTYTNEYGDQLVFEREYDEGTDQYWEFVTVRPKVGDEYTLVRLKGFLGNLRAVAYGIYF